jgi:hypothetical protein
LRNAFTLSRNHTASSVGRGWCNNLHAELFGAFEEKPDLLFAMALFVVFCAFVDILLTVF